MPYEEADETDPMLLVGVELPAEPTSARETAQVIAEEYARMGFTEEQLMEVFSSPFYAGAHQAFRELGEEAIRAISREQTAFWGRVCFRDRDTDPETRLALLNVIEPTRREDRHA